MAWRTDARRLLREPLVLVPRPPEQLREHRPRDAQCLLHDRAKARVFLHLRPPKDAKPLADLLRREDEQGENRDRQNREPPLQAQHDNQRGRGGDEGGDDAQETGGDRLLGSLNVRVQAGHELARPGVGEEPERHLLNVPEQLAPEVVNDSLAHGRRPVTLHDYHSTADQGNGDHSKSEPGDETQVSSRNRRIDQRPHEQRRNQAEERIDHDSAEDEPEQSAVRPRVCDYPAKQRPIDVGRGLLLVVGHVGPPARDASYHERNLTGAADGWQVHRTQFIYGPCFRS